MLWKESTTFDASQSLHRKLIYGIDQAIPELSLRAERSHVGGHVAPVSLGFFKIKSILIAVHGVCKDGCFFLHLPVHTSKFTLRYLQCQKDFLGWVTDGPRRVNYVRVRCL
uniref:Uncharacterized protein n=1 Tax=Romanomermis culicivorax TaxID=13658 RepID=A0A915L1H9_ROMCU